ncbi:lysis protein [Cronobacter sakazakii]|uniref:lysis protein n=1 Tax=Cronobacter sakazakii TaxID=28141 RepID=UPI000E0823C4|nr:Bacteriophage lysis protein [Cronobacter sakazakii]
MLWRALKSRQFPWLMLFVLVGSLWLAWHHTRSELKASRVALSLAQRQLSLTQHSLRQTAQLDARYTRELNHARETIDALERNVAAGRQRLRLNAACLRTSGSTARVDDGAAPRLTDAAERDYFRLRTAIAVVTRQLSGLQEYIRQECPGYLTEGVDSEQ